jgi:hypothetical protein
MNLDPFFLACIIGAGIIRGEVVKREKRQPRVVKDDLKFHLVTLLF